MDIGKISSVIRSDIEATNTLLETKDSIREEVYRLVRELIRASGDVVTLVHRGLYNDAKDKLDLARSLLVKINDLLNDHPDLYYSGMVYNGLSEFVEASLFYGIIVENKAYSVKELGVPYVPYLQGLGDLVGEIRRYVIKLLDKGMIEEAEEYLNIMEEIYVNLRRLDYPDALTPGLRHKVDVAARLIEDTRVLVLSTRNAYLCIKNSSRNKQ